MDINISLGFLILLVELIFMMISLFFAPDRVARWIWTVWLAVGLAALVLLH